MRTSLIACLTLALFLLIVIGCDGAPLTATPPDVVVQEEPAPTTRAIPTLYPTTTTQPTIAPTDTKPPEPTTVPSTPIDFEQVAVDITYRVPLLSLDRRIIGRVSNRIELVDLNTGESVELPDQPGILLELQQVFNDIELEVLPDDCSGCVSIDYQLPIIEQAGAGWLMDDQLLASLENFTSVHLGPHFPPQTVVGLRKSATAYHAAQTVALTADYRLWRYSATDAEIFAPDDSDLLESGEITLPDQDFIKEIPEPAMINCTSGPGVEMLYLDYDGQAYSFQFSCPSLTLPAVLVPVYSPLDQLSHGSVSDSQLTEPEPILALDTLIDYRKPNELVLSILTNGQTMLTMTHGISLTTTISHTLLMSVTSELLESNLLQTSAEAYLTQGQEKYIFVRGPESVHSLGWLGLEDNIMKPLIDILDELIAVIGQQATTPSTRQPASEVTTESTRKSE